MMVKVLLYGYATGVRSSRRLARGCVEDVAFRVLAVNNAPDFRALSEFRRRHLAALGALFQQVLRLCRQAGLVKLGTVALDSTKIKGPASRFADRGLHTLKGVPGEWRLFAVDRWAARLSPRGALSARPPRRGGVRGRPRGPPPPWGSRRTTAGTRGRRPASRRGAPSPRGAPGPAGSGRATRGRTPRGRRPRRDRPRTADAGGRPTRRSAPGRASSCLVGRRGSRAGPPRAAGAGDAV
ncbi:MAG: transposase [Candidatus Rokubacteria bacterium]|nr:transposase [Candidatus Rokubacteria bacterium]